VGNGKEDVSLRILNLENDEKLEKMTKNGKNYET